MSQISFAGEKGLGFEREPTFERSPSKQKLTEHNIQKPARRPQNPYNGQTTATHSRRMSTKQTPEFVQIDHLQPS